MLAELGTPWHTRQLTVYTPPPFMGLLTSNLRFRGSPVPGFHREPGHLTVTVRWGKSMSKSPRNMCVFRIPGCSWDWGPGAGL